MKVIGLQIKSNKLIISILKDDDSTIIDETGKLKYIELEDDSDPAKVKSFMNVVHRHFDNINADRIAIIKRNSNAKGDRTPSPVSFKLEGLIQLYENKDVRLIAPQTIKAFLKRNPQLIVSTSLKYQQEAFELAQYLLKS